MANLIRTSKSASDWGRNELRAYNVTVEEQDAAQFFGMERLPEPNCPPGFLNNRFPTDETDFDADCLLQTLMDAGRSSVLGEAAVDTFAYTLFLASGFASKKVFPAMRRPLELGIGGDARSAQTDVCVVHKNTVLLLVQEDKREERPPGHGESQLVAEAIAARQNNVAYGAVEEHATQVMPAILMVGTYPVFYKIPVSPELDISVAALSYPQQQTEVTRCSPVVPRPGVRYEEGMGPLDNRRVILQYLEAFRRAVFIPCSEAVVGPDLGLA